MNNLAETRSLIAGEVELSVGEPTHDHVGRALRLAAVAYWRYPGSFDKALFNLRVLMNAHRQNALNGKGFDESLFDATVLWESGANTRHLKPS